MLQQWKSKVHRWQQLTRYYVNKWQYDGSKWAERVWYGTGPQNANSVASVPFMITRNMRNELEQAGFPAHEISGLLPKVAHQLINDKVSYAKFQETRAQYETATAQEEEKKEGEHKEVKEIVAAIQARETREEEAARVDSTTTQIAIVPDAAAKSEERL